LVCNSFPYCGKEHAKLCFTVASIYAGVQIEPQYYESHTVTINPDIRSIIKGTIQEGCIEETISALKTALDYIEEEDSYIKQVYYKITIDEAHHASFAWKVLKWAVKSFGDLAEKFF